MTSDRNTTLQGQPGTARLRILATTDLHMQIQGFDYVSDAPEPNGGLARLVPLIKDARNEAADTATTCLLLDNGDTLQGNAMADILARMPEHDNPIVRSFNALHYDAIGLGNHDFDYGLQNLATAIRHYEMPVLCSNLKSDDLPGLQNQIILTRAVTMDDGSVENLRIGVLSVLPPQTATWNQNHLSGKADIMDAVEAIEKMVPDLRKAGADIVILLAHMGIVAPSLAVDRQNVALEAAQIEGVDALIAGHTHMRFPDEAYPVIEGVDAKNGTLAGVPAALPGVAGSDLAVIDLMLRRDGPAKWTVEAHLVGLRSPEPEAPEAEDILALAAPVHKATRDYLAHPVGQLSSGMHSYFALADPSPVPALLALTKRRVIEDMIAGTALEDLPLLASASSPATGGVSGPTNFVTLPKGTIERRHIAGLSPFANQIWAIKVSGLEIVDWLERSARLFNILMPDTPDQELANPAIPGFFFDGLYGITYQFDPTSATKYDATGAVVDPGAKRVRDVHWQGQPIDPDQTFLVATTHYRAGGGGGFEPIAHDRIALRTQIQLSDALADHMTHINSETLATMRPWGFTQTAGVSTILQTSPDALAHLADIQHLRPEPCGQTSDGFVRIRLHL